VLEWIFMTRLVVGPIIIIEPPWSTACLHRVLRVITTCLFLHRYCYVSSILFVIYFYFLSIYIYIYICIYMYVCIDRNRRTVGVWLLFC
jgi:hypothetical protein